MQIDTNKLAEYLKNKKFDEAKKMLEDFVKSPMTEEEQGGVLASAVIRHMELMNSIEKEYIDSMQELLNELKELDKKGAEIKDKDALDKVRSKLSNI